MRIPVYPQYTALDPLWCKVHVEPWALFRAGDHVRVWRGLYWHHAIYIGRGILVEFGSSIRGGNAAYVDWHTFAREATVDLVMRGGLAAATRAESQVGRDDFDVLTRNCEHFATWCAVGRWESGQIGAVKLAALCCFAALLVGKTA